MEAREHDFTPADNQLIRDVSTRMKIWAWLVVGSALLSLGTTAYQMISLGMGVPTLLAGLGGTGISVAIYFVVAFLTLAASGSLETAARAGGNDVTYMMKALTSLKSLYGFIYWLIVIVILLSILIGIGVFIAVMRF